MELGARRRGGSRGVWARRRGWEATLGRGGADGGVGVGGAGLWWRVDGGGELVGVQAGRWRRSEVWEHGKGERRRGIACGDRSSARAHER